MSNEPAMRVKLWGVRGGIASSPSSEDILGKHARLIQELALNGGFEKAFRRGVPSIQRIKDVIEELDLSTATTGTYGSNTTCVEVQVRNSPLIVLDAGTGMRPLGDELVRRYSSDRKLNPLSGLEANARELHLLFSHAHHDHIQGFPFFAPGYALERSDDPEKNVHVDLRVWGRRYEGRTMLDILSDQQKNPQFPAPFRAGVPLKWTRNTVLEDSEGDDLKIGEAEITALELPHGFETVTGYRIMGPHGTFAFITDIETPESRDDNLFHLIDSVDVVYFDAQYTPQEAASKKGWGHSTWKVAVDYALEARAKRVLLGHHDPKRNDMALEKEILEPARRYAERKRGEHVLRVDLTCEGEEILFE